MSDSVDSLKPVRFDDVSPESNIEQEREVMGKKPQSLGLKIFLSLIIVFAGIASGYGLNQLIPGVAKGSTTTVQPPADNEALAVGKVYGNPDSTKFPDEAEGVLVRGGAEGEGSHHLMRVGGPSRNVYMTSSVMDLSIFEEHKVKVWGETFQSQHAGWLMDVGRVELIEMNAEKPFETTPTTTTVLGD